MTNKKKVSLLVALILIVVGAAVFLNHRRTHRAKNEHVPVSIRGYLSRISEQDANCSPVWTEAFHSISQLVDNSPMDPRIVDAAIDLLNAAPRASDKLFAEHRALLFDAAGKPTSDAIEASDESITNMNCRLSNFSHALFSTQEILKNTSVSPAQRKLFKQAVVNYAEAPASTFIEMMLQIASLKNASEAGFCSDKKLPQIEAFRKRVEAFHQTYLDRFDREVQRYNWTRDRDRVFTDARSREFWLSLIYFEMDSLKGLHQELRDLSHAACSTSL